MSKGAIVVSATPSLVGATLGQMIEHDHDKNIIIVRGGNVTNPAFSALAYSSHTHGVPNITGQLSITSNSNDWSISIADFLTTAADVSHTHSDLYIPLANSTAYQTSILDNTFLTTAALSNHSHTQYAGTGVSATNANVTLNSNGLAIEIVGGTGGADGYNIIAAGTQTAGTASTVRFANSNNISFGMSNGSVITASVSQSTHAHPYLSSVSSSLFDTSYLSTALMPLAYSSQFQTATLASTFMTLREYAGTQVSATNVGLSVDSNGISVSVDTAGLSVLGDGVNILAAGSQTAGSNNTILFANSNNISFGMSNNTIITASFSESTHDHPFLASNESSNYATSVLSNNLAVISHTHGAISTQTVTGDNIVHTSASNGLTLGIPEYLTTYVAQSVQPVAVSASNSSIAFSTLTMGNSNGLSFYMTNGSVVASYTVPTQTSEPRVVSLNNTSGNIILQAGNNITVSPINGSTISIHAPSSILNSFAIGGNSGTTNSSNITGGGFILAGGDNVTLSQSNNMISIYGASGGPVIGASDTTFTGGTVVISAEANMTVGTTVNAGIQYIKLSANIAGSTAGDGVNIIAAGSETAYSTGTIVFSNSNGISFGMSDNYVVTASHNALTSQSAQAVSASNGSMAFQTLNFGNANSISFYTSNDSLLASFDPPGTFSQTLQDMYYSAANASTSNGTILFGNTNGVSFSISNGSVIGSVRTDYIQTSVSSTLAGTGFTSTTIAGALVDGTHDSLGLKLAVPAFLTTAMQSQSSSVFARTGFSSSTVTGTRLDAIHDTNGLSMAVPKFITTAMLSNAGSNFVGLNTAQTNVIWTVNSNGISFNAGNYARTGFTTTTITGNVITGVHNTAGLFLSVPNYLTNVALTGYAGTGFTTGSTAGSNIAGTLATNGLSLRVPNFLTTAANSTHTHSQYVNTTETGNVYFVNSNSITFGSSVSNNNTSITASFGGTFTGTAAGAVTFSAGTQSRSLASVVFSNANGASFGLNGSTITASYTVPPMGTLSLMNSNGISFGTAVAGNTTTVTASVNTAYIQLTNSSLFGRAWIISNNTLGTSSSVYGSVLRLVGSNNITLSGSSDGKIVILGAAGTGGGVGIADSASSATAGIVNFSNANGISFRLSGYTMTASHNAYTASAQLTSAFLALASSTAYNTTVLSTALMPLAYSSAFQTSILDNSFMPLASSSVLGRIRAIGITNNSSAFTSGSVMISAQNLTVNTSVNGASQYLQISAPKIGYLFFSNNNNLSWSSSTNGVSTSVWMYTA